MQSEQTVRTSVEFNLSTNKSVAEKSICHYGLQLIARHNVGVVFLAGGIGSRVGGLITKTCIQIPKLGCSCLEHLVNKVLSENIDVAIMVSKHTFAEVMSKLGDKVSYFEQGTRHAYNENTKNEVGEFPTGHGSVYDDLKRSGILDKWVARHIDYVILCMSDNPAMYVLDPHFIGSAACDNSIEMTVKVVEKTSQNDPCGHVFRESPTRHFVIDYRQSFGNVVPKYGYTGYQMVKIDSIRLKTFNLPYHSSVKDGVQKMEQHIGDAVSKVESRLYLVGQEQFSPIKHPSGRWSISGYEATIEK